MIDNTITSIESSLRSIASSLAVLVALQNQGSTCCETVEVERVETLAPAPAAKKKTAKKRAATAETVEAEVVQESSVTIADVRTVAAQLLEKPGGSTAFATLMKAAGLAKLSEAEDKHLSPLFDAISAKLEELSE